MQLKKIRAKVVAVLLVSSVLLLICLNTGGGTLEPMVPPAPTMHTLNEIYSAVAGSSSESGTRNTYMKFEGVDGESTDKHHPDWIEILNFSGGVAKGGTGGETTVEDLVITKWMDKASPYLYLAVCTGQVFNEVTLDLVEPIGNRNTYMQYKMYSVSINRAAASGSKSPSPSSGSSDRPLEDISLKYLKIDWTYQQLDTNGDPIGTAITTGYDFQP